MRTSPPLRITALGALSALLLGGCAETLREQPTVQELESRAVEKQQEYVIGSGDNLSISVWQQQELSLDSVVVRLDGKISVPLLDDVVAEGLTPTQLKAVLTEQLTEFILEPQVTVVVRQINSKRIYIIGEVNREGPIALASGMRVVDALSVAGGFRTFAEKNRIKIIRNQNGGPPVEFVFAYDDFVDGKNLEQNILLLPGDQIVVPEQTPFWRR